jgi:hypothetical protein
MRLRGGAQISFVVAFGLLVGGCAAPIIGGMTLGTLSTIADGISSLFTGKSLEEHALSLMTGKDCNLTESILRNDRKLCEEKYSVATREDFKGIFSSYGDDKSDLLDRYGRARQQELADAGEAKPFAVTQANLVTLPVHDGVPARGEKPGYAKIGNIVVYIMAPIYELADLIPPKHLGHRDEDKPATGSSASDAPVSIAPMKQ